MNSEAFDLLEDYLEEKSDVFASITLFFAYTNLKAKGVLPTPF